MRRKLIFTIAILFIHSVPVERIFAVCDIEADPCCGIFQALDFGARSPIPTASTWHQVSTFVIIPEQRYEHSPDPSIESPHRTKTIERAGGADRLKERVKRQLEADGVAPSIMNKMMTAVGELVQNAADAHVRNGTNPATRRITVRLKVNRRHRSAEAGSNEIVDQVILEVTDNAGNATAKRNAGDWFSGGRESGVSAVEARAILDRYSAQLKNPIQMAKEAGITKKEHWKASDEYRALLAQVEKENAPILDKISDAQLPPDRIAEYFDAKLPEDAGASLDRLSTEEAEVLRSEISAEREFWFDTRFAVRAKYIAVEGREGGMGGFGSLMMKGWGSQWVYGPNRDGSGATVGTRTLYILETPVSPITNPELIGGSESRPTGIQVQPDKPKAPGKVIDTSKPARSRPGTLILPTTP